MRWKCIAIMLIVLLAGALVPNLQVVREVEGAAHGTIRINSDAEFNATVSLEGWQGSGTFSDPYIIENYTIDSLGNGNGIYIGNTTVAFRIENCTISHSSQKAGVFQNGAGIALFNVVNGGIYNNTCIGNDMGIYLDTSSVCAIQQNTCEQNAGNGIYLLDSWNNSIWENTIEENSASGIVLVSSSSSNKLTVDNWLHNNLCANNSQNGVELVDADDNIITENAIVMNSGRGIFLRISSSQNIFEKNLLFDNQDYGIMAMETAGSNGFYENAFFFNKGSGGAYDEDRIQAYDSIHSMNTSHNFWNTVTQGNYWYDHHNATGYPIAPDVFGVEDKYPLSKVPTGLYDPIVPVLNIISPLPGTTLSSNNITVEWNAVDDYLITGYRIRIDTDSWLSLNSTNYTFANISVGLHTVEVQAFDPGSNVVSAFTNFTITTSLNGTVSYFPTGSEIAADSEIVITFETPMTTIDVDITGPNGKVASITSWSGNTLTVDPVGLLPIDAVCNVTVNGTDADGTPIVPFYWVFDTYIHAFINGMITVEGMPLEGVLISIGSFTTTTDDQGNYNLSFLPGSHTYEMSKEGFTTFSGNINMDAGEFRGIDHEFTYGSHLEEEGLGNGGSSWAYLLVVAMIVGLILLLVISKTRKKPKQYAPVPMDIHGNTMPAPSGWVGGHQQGFIEPAADSPEQGVLEQGATGQQEDVAPGRFDPIPAAPVPPAPVQQNQAVPAHAQPILSCPNCSFSSPPPNGPPRALKCPQCGNIIEP